MTLHDNSEELVKMGKCVVMRHHLWTLNPGHMPHEKIFEMFAMRLTLASQRPEGTKFWCFPPSFADDYRRGHRFERLVRAYKEPWMPTSKLLKHVKEIHISS
ncbi:hypothetical protein PIB30_092065 [Stylosanthes scabra]|uniref:Uncharacterized protein n=1 Tax=Stylosanthes scabra TaxID=79078 RepID=A0ABU6YTS1_9FABA|nr:hypothetical protein [Stylosanthes scabra]